MAMLLASTPALPSLDRALEAQNFRDSCDLYNTLRDDGDQLPIDDKHSHNLAKLFAIPKDTVLLGTSFEGPIDRWARVTQIKDVDHAAVHGHMFVYQKDRFCAYEYQYGLLPDFSTVSKDFLPEFVGYLVANDLTSLIGLQVLGDLRKAAPVVTGWTFEAGPYGPRACQANETHTKMNSRNHKVFNVGKPHPKLENLDDLKAALAVAGVI
ncbi:hypothetical protein GGR55DRAFT_679330 [Xylaria sp. FL0064]|nr:hypothetical protein GGR55DRAFT_679330 [Xylaria sp. FL0064]